MLQHSTAVQPPNALLYGTFVKIAYDVFDANPNNTNPSASDYPPLPSGYELLFNIQMKDFFGKSTYPQYYGFFAINTATSEIVVAMRGTVTWVEWWDDFHWGLVPFPYYNNGANVADGFFTIYNTITVTAPGPNAKQAMLLKDTAAKPELIKADGSFTLYAAGHSLGAALITL